MEMETAIRVQNLDEAVYVSHSTNTFEKIMNSTIFRLAWVNSWADCAL